MTLPLTIAMFTAHGCPEPNREWQFAPPRKWRFDYAWIPHKVALEVEGGIFERRNKGGHAGWHQSVERMLSDMEKYNRAALLGWRVLRCTPKQLNSGEAAALVAAALEIPGA